MLSDPRQISPSFPLENFSIIVEYGGSNAAPRFSSPSKFGSFPCFHFIKVELDMSSACGQLSAGVTVPYGVKIRKVSSSHLLTFNFFYYKYHICRLYNMVEEFVLKVSNPEQRSNLYYKWCFHEHIPWFLRVWKSHKINTSVYLNLKLVCLIAGIQVSSLTAYILNLCFNVMFQNMHRCTRIYDWTLMPFL